MHCADNGHTVVGDYTYSDRQDTQPYRMMLHACKFSVKLPIENIDVVTEDPFTPQSDQSWAPQKAFLGYEDFEEMLRSEDNDKNGENFKTNTGNGASTHSVISGPSQPPTLSSLVIGDTCNSKSSYSDVLSSSVCADKSKGFTPFKTAIEDKDQNDSNS